MRLRIPPSAQLRAQKIDLSKLRQDHRVLKLARRWIAYPAEGDGAGVRQGEITGRVFGRQRDCRFASSISIRLRRRSK
jgi:hypothetical protein